MKKLLVSFFMLLTLIVGLNTVEINAENPINNQFDFNYEIQLGSSEIIEDGFVTPMSVNYGQVVSIDAGSLVEENYEFVGYILNGKVVYNPSIINQGIRVTEDTNITAFFKDINETAVIFTDSNQDYLGIVRYTDEFDKVPYDTENPIPDYTVLSKPGLEPIGWTENGLDTIDFDVDTFTQDTVVAVLYDVASNIDPVNLTVTNGQLATGEPSSGEYEYNQIATVEADTAPQGEYFQYWLKDGNIASLQETYSFTMLADTTVEAVYGQTEDYQSDDLFIGLSNPYQIRDNYNSFIGQFFLPDGEEMIEYGVIASESPGEITLDTYNIIKIRSNRYYSETNEFMRSIPDSLSGFIRAYMITTDGTNTTITYSPEYTDWDNTETFDESNASGSYDDGSFVGENSIGWTYVAAQDEGSYSIDSVGLMFRSNDDDYDPYLLSDTIQGGIDILSIDMRKAFTGGANDRQIKVTITPTYGEIQEYTSQIFGDSGTDENINVFLIENINVIGDFTIKIENMGEQITIDNISWLNYYPEGGASPIISGHSDLSIIEGENIDPLQGVSAVDFEDGDLTSSIDYVVKDNTNTIIDPVDFTTLSDGNYTVEYSVEDSYGNVVTDSINLEVLPLATYTVTFDSNEGSTVNPITDIDINTTISEPDPAPTKTGYVFYSWFSDSDLTNEFDFSTPITEDITLYAGWNKDGYDETTYTETGPGERPEGPGGRGGGGDLRRGSVPGCERCP
ncbi:MAG: InlB B-repeat-containing protein, partial [Candidatus Izemoplasmatales bacterium]